VVVEVVVVVCGCVWLCVVVCCVWLCVQVEVEWYGAVEVEWKGAPLKSTSLERGEHPMEWSGVERKGTEGTEMGRSGVEWSGAERGGAERNRVV
jgi:hypothetical protein